MCGVQLKQCLKYYRIKGYIRKQEKSQIHDLNFYLMKLEKEQSIPKTNRKEKHSNNKS